MSRDQDQLLTPKHCPRDIAGNVGQNQINYMNSQIWRWSRVNFSSMRICPKDLAFELIPTQVWTRAKLSLNSTSMRFCKFQWFLSPCKYGHLTMRWTYFHCPSGIYLPFQYTYNVSINSHSSLCYLLCQKIIIIHFVILKLISQPFFKSSLFELKDQEAGLNQNNVQVSLALWNLHDPNVCPRYLPLNMGPNWYSNIWDMVDIEFYGYVVLGGWYSVKSLSCQPQLGLNVKLDCGWVGGLTMNT